MPSRVVKKWTKMSGVVSENIGRETYPDKDGRARDALNTTITDVGIITLTHSDEITMIRRL